MAVSLFRHMLAGGLHVGSCLLAIFLTHGSSMYHPAGNLDFELLSTGIRY